MPVNYLVITLEIPNRRPSSRLGASPADPPAPRFQPRLHRIMKTRTKCNICGHERDLEPGAEPCPGCLLMVCVAMHPSIDLEELIGDRRRFVLEASSEHSAEFVLDSSILESDMSSFTNVSPVAPRIAADQANDAGPTHRHEHMQAGDEARTRVLVAETVAFSLANRDEIETSFFASRAREAPIQPTFVIDATENRNITDAIDASNRSADSTRSDFAESVARILGNLRAPRIVLKDPSDENREADGSIGSIIQNELRESIELSHYKVEAEIARGGMGVIYRVRDIDLNRSLAIKVLHQSHRHKPEMILRFIEEAQIVGQLQHPGIVPVHEAGVLADGRPYFTMKLVKGRTLADLLADRPNPAADLPRFLAIFDQICRTIAYAHSRGVIHRDLKPSNVMAGAFGEVQVMDWGLAKVSEKKISVCLNNFINHSDDFVEINNSEMREATATIHDYDRAAAETVAEVSRVVTARSGKTGSNSGSGSGSGSGFESRAGSILGTPVYMAPEQARGEVESLDPRCDVFGLGGILCVILTGRPPRGGGSADAVVQAARTDELEITRNQIETCESDSEIRALALRCLEFDPAKRPRDAAEVAEAIGAYLEGARERLRLSELARVKAEVEVAAERRRRRLTAALAVAIGSIVVILGTAMFSALQARSARIERAIDIERRMATTLDRAARLYREGRSAEAEDSVEAARTLFTGTTSHINDTLKQKIADFKMLGAIDAVRYRPIEAGGGRAIADRAARGYANAFRDYGVDIDREDFARHAERIARGGIRFELVAALDDWIRLESSRNRRNNIVALADAIDPSPASLTFRLRSAIEKRDRTGLVALASDPRIADSPPTIVNHLADTLLSVKAETDAIALLRTATERRQGDFWLHIELAAALLIADRRKEDAVEAEKHVAAALALSRGSPNVHFYLGTALHKNGKFDRAATSFQNAIQRKPDYVEAYNNLGNALTSLKQYESAINNYQTAIKLNPRYAQAYHNMAWVYEELERYESAVDAYEKAIAIEPDYVEARCNLGRIFYFYLGDFRRAADEIDRGLKLLPKDHYLYNNMLQIRNLSNSMAEHEPAFAAYRAGTYRPTEIKEILALARLCSWRSRKLYSAATDLYKLAFKADPALAENLDLGDRYNAASVAAAAGTGLGADAQSLADADRRKLREQAVAWLRADLKLRERQIERSPDKRAQIQAVLKYWLKDKNLNRLLDASAIADLPDDERTSLKALRSDLDRLIQACDRPAESVSH